MGAHLSPPALLAWLSLALLKENIMVEIGAGPDGRLCRLLAIFMSGAKHVKTLVYLALI